MTSATLHILSPDVERTVSALAERATGLMGPARWRAYERAKDVIAAACLDVPEQYGPAVRAYLELVDL